MKKQNKNKMLSFRMSDQDLKSIKKAKELLNGKNTSHTIRKAIQYALEHKQESK